MYLCNYELIDGLNILNMTYFNLNLILFKMKINLPMTTKNQVGQFKLTKTGMSSNRSNQNEKENIISYENIIIGSNQTPKPKQNILLNAINSNIISKPSLSTKSLVKISSASSSIKYQQESLSSIKNQPKEVHSNKIISKQQKKIPLHNRNQINNLDSLNDSLSITPESIPQTMLFNKVIKPTFNPILDKVKYSSNGYGHIEGYSASTNQGNYRNYNEDRVSIILNISKPSTFNGDWPKCSFFGIYDGHAGSLCADFLRDNLHKYIINDSNFPKNPQKAILNGFLTAEDVFLKYCLANNCSSGSCALVIIIIEKKCFVANVGDSRAIMSGNNGDKLYVLSRDHRPADEKEYKRIIEAGGKIYQTEANIISKDKNENFLGPLRVKPGKLSVSRTIGDIEAKLPQFGGNPEVIIGVPEIKYFDLNDNYDFIVLGCKYLLLTIID